MRPTELISLLSSHLASQIPTLILGSPGIGKSDIVHQVAEAHDLELQDLRLSQLDTVDLRGVPKVISGVTHWNPPEFFPRDAKSKGILFLDELTSCSTEMQAAAYQLILDRRIGDYELPDGWHVIGAGNRVTDGAIANKLSSALCNRMAHVTLDTDLDDWCKWAAKMRIDSRIISFLRFQPQLLNELTVRQGNDGDAKRANHARQAMAFATPRTWSMVARTLDQKASKEVERLSIPSIVGEAAALPFIAFCDLVSGMPDIDAILKNPLATPLPDRKEILLATIGGLAARTTTTNFANALKYVDRITEMEYRAYFIRDAASHTPKLMQSRDYTSWVAKHGREIY